MRVYNRKEFIKLPDGVLFSKGKRWYWDGLSVKDGTNDYNDFYYTDLMTIESEDDGDWSQKLEDMLQYGTSEPINQSGGRDGCFDDNDLFLVFEKNDLIALREHINNAIGDHQ